MIRALIKKIVTWIKDKDQLIKKNEELAEQIDVLIKDNKTLQNRIDRLPDIASYLVSSNRMTKEEANQLGITGIKDFDPRAMLEGGDADQATKAQFRQIKQHYVAHKKATETLVNQLNSLTRRNQITGKDMDNLRELLDKLRNSTNGQI
ncbi:MAG: hypothetical protein KTR28_08765 [Micavibrio sp.]|nr:hypothetical protein [Micavibrio sp.]